MQYSVKIDAFEGPLDLLLHLLNRYEIDIYDIPVAEITDQYMAYIQTMQELELDIASEYLVMAATLLAMKSKMLLPKAEPELPDDEWDEMIDPRDELIQRLVEYRKYKQAAVELKEREADRSQLYTKDYSDMQEFMDDEPKAPAASDITLYDMLGALKSLLERKQFKKPKSTKIQRQEIPIEARMSEILTELQQRQGKSSFTSLFPSHEREHIVVTFLAVLELLKQKSIHCEQQGNFAEIWIYRSTIEGVQDHE